MLWMTLAIADPIDLEVVSKVQFGQPASLTLVVNQQAQNIDARVDCGGAWAETHGGAGAGDRLVLELEANPGTHVCQGELKAVFSDGSLGEMPLSFEIVVFDELKLTVPRQHVDLEGKTLHVAMDRAPKEVTVTTYGAGDVVLGSGTMVASGEGPGDFIEVQWSGAGEVLRLVVKGTDADGFWSELTLFPWYYEIPHEDVVFETAQADIPPVEVIKLEKALVEVDKVLLKYGDHAEVKLYVGGYTDTVGGRASNENLSTLRALSIAKWFRDSGFEGAIYYQGFGEDGQAVKTLDETDEPQNRRALYILAAEPPPQNEQLPRRDWRPL